MQLSKSKITTILGVSGILFFIGLAYFKNYIFLDKLLVCSLILGLVFLIKTKGEVDKSNENLNA